MISPTTWVDVENLFELSMIKLKPVMAAEVMGETAMSTVITELGTVEMYHMQHWPWWTQKAKRV